MPKTSKTQQTATSVTTTVEEPITESPAIVESSVEVVGTEKVHEDLQEVNNVFSKMQMTIEMFNKLQQDVKDINNNLKFIQKFMLKNNKVAAKKSTKNQKDKKPPSGFAKPTKISDELAEFLNLEKGSLLARTDVTRLINQYIVKNNLQDPKDRRHIIPDDSLRNIMQLEKDSTENVTYFNLQRFIKHHFMKET